MKRFRTVTALAIVLALAFSTVVMAAPSPAAGTVSVVLPGNTAATAARVVTPTPEELAKLAEFILQNMTALGMTADVKSSIKIVAPDGYKGGTVPIVFAVAGLKTGAKNIFAYILLPNGKKIIVPCVVKNGYVGFFAPAFGTVAIVELNDSTATAANATLH